MYAWKPYIYISHRASILSKHIGGGICIIYIFTLNVITGSHPQGRRILFISRYTSRKLGALVYMELIETQQWFLNLEEAKGVFSHQPANFIEHLSRSVYSDVTQ